MQGPTCQGGGTRLDSLTEKACRSFTLLTEVSTIRSDIIRLKPEANAEVVSYASPHDSMTATKDAICSRSL